MPCTHFWDMSSGGGQKLNWKHIFIEADEETAIAYFKQRFSRDPDHVTCDCCGPDYSVSEDDSLEAATAYQRGCKDNAEGDDYDYSTGKPIGEYMQQDNVLFIIDRELRGFVVVPSTRLQEIRERLSLDWAGFTRHDVQFLMDLLDASQLEGTPDE